MNQIQKNKFYKIMLLTFVLAAVLGLLTYALRQNINLYFTPYQISQGEAPTGKMMRAGGMVLKGTLVRAKDELKVSFAITDFKANIQVIYRGILPDLFREGQGVVVRGRLNSKGEIEALEVLAKHDESYMPPEVKASLEESKA